MPVLIDILKGVFTKGDGKIAEIVKESVDEVFYTKEEKAEDILEHEKWQEEQEHRLQTLEYEQYNKELDALVNLEKLDVENVKSAREREVAITTSENVGILNKNIMPIIALFILLATFIMYIILIFKKTAIVALDMAVVGSIIDTFKTLSTLIVGYYFGSSMSSGLKDKIINNLQKNENNTTNP